MSLIGQENENKPNLMANAIEEVKLKNRRKANKANAERMSEVLKRRRIEFKKKRKENEFLTPEKIIKANRDRLCDLKRYKRQDRRLNNALIPVDSTEGLIIVLRLNITNEMFKSTRAILNKYHLSQPLSAVFMRKTPEVIRDLILVEPYVAWGTPSMTLIQDLLTKHAFTIIDKKRVAVSDNIMVEDHLGSKDVICIADMVKEIQTMGPAFDDVLQFLAPFVFTSSYSQIEVRVLRQNKVESGDLGEKINEVIRKML